MSPEERERMGQLIKHIQIEQDYTNFKVLVDELTAMLNRKEQHLNQRDQQSGSL